MLAEVKEFKDLEITTNHHLSWNPHRDYVVSKANRMLGLIKRTCKGMDDALRTLYCSLVRSNLEYCSVEGVQRRATKLILKSDDPYDIRLKKSNLMSLEKRRSLADVTFIYKALIFTSVKL